MLFEDLNLEYEILDGLETMNYYEATPIQEATIPLLLEGRDMIACAQTGTGKTAAYLLPILNKISRGAVMPNKVSAIIMAPTRELVLQIEQQITGFAYYLPVSAVAIHGGGDGIAFAQQERGLTLGADIIIATPGRLISILNIKNVDFSGMSYFVLDEADRMLDMGFMDDIMQINSLIPNSCQKVMFSATMPPKIRQLAKSILKNPSEVTIAISRPPESIRQSAYICYKRQKYPLIQSLFEATPPERAIVFCSSKVKVKELASAIARIGICVSEMHSDLSQSKRERVMQDFKNGHIKLLIATDIIARGIDVDNIDMVINYDIPHNAEDYVHRIGRTARGNNDHGIAITFVSEEEQAGFAHIEEFLGKPVPKESLPEAIGVGPEYNPSNAPKGNRRKGSKGRPNRSGNKPSSKKQSAPRRHSNNANNATSKVEKVGKQTKGEHAPKHRFHPKRRSDKGTAKETKSE